MARDIFNYERNSAAGKIHQGDNKIRDRVKRTRTEIVSKIIVPADERNSARDNSQYGDT
jgi:hypothetical protein